MLRHSNFLRRVWYPATVAAGLGELVTDAATGRKRYVGLAFHNLRRANAQRDKTVFQPQMHESRLMRRCLDDFR